MEKDFDWAHQVRQCIKPLVSRRWIKNIHLPSFPDSNSHQDVRLAFKAEFCCFSEKAPLTSIPLLRLCSSGIWVTFLYPQRLLGHHVGCWRDGIILKSHDSRCWGLLNIFNLGIEDCCGGLKLNRLSFPQAMLSFWAGWSMLREGIGNVIVTNKYQRDWYCHGVQKITAMKCRLKKWSSRQWPCWYLSVSQVDMSLKRFMIVVVDEGWGIICSFVWSRATISASDCYFVMCL